MMTMKMQDQEHQRKPLAAAEDYPRSDMELGWGGKINQLNNALRRRDKEKSSSKCLVYVLAVLVIVGIALLAFASIFLRPTTPDVKIRSVTVRNLKYIGANSSTNSSSSAPSFNLTLLAEVTVKNSNFGEFRFENTTGGVWCGSVVVGEMKIPTGTAQARATERLNVSVDVSSLRLSDYYANNLSSNISSGLLEFNSYVKLGGRLNIMNIMKRRRHPELNCFINLNFTAHSVQDLTCY